MTPSTNGGDLIQVSGKRNHNKPQGLYKMAPSTNGGESGQMARGTTTNHKVYTRWPPQLMVENPGKWREEPQQTTRFIQDGPLN